MATVTASGARRFKLSKFILSWYGILIVYAIMTGIFLLLRLGDGNNPIALSIGSLTFRWYGIIITVGVIIASFLAQFLAERRGDDPDHVWRILPVLLIFGIVAARFWYVFNTWEGYKDYFFSIGNPTHAGAIEIWRGGIAIQGAVVGGILGALLYGIIYNRMQARKEARRRFSLWRFSDFVAPGLVLAQGIGRWGNFMNNEAYGRETKLPWGIKIPCEYRTSGSTPGTDNTLCSNAILPNNQLQVNGIDKDALFHPTFFYESLWNYFTFLVLFFCIMKPKTIERRFKVKLRDGDIFLLYWVVYSIGRFFTEGFRTDSLYFMGNTGSLRTAQVIAIVSILIAGFLLFYRHRKSFPATEALSMRLAPAMVGVPAGAAVPVDAPVSTGKTTTATKEAVPADAAVAAEDWDDDGGDELDDSDKPADWPSAGFAAVPATAPDNKAATVDTDTATVSESPLEVDDQPAEDGVEEAPATPLHATVVETAEVTPTNLGDLDAQAEAPVQASNAPVEAETFPVQTAPVVEPPTVEAPASEEPLAEPEVEVASATVTPIAEAEEETVPAPGQATTVSVVAEPVQAEPFQVETAPVSGEIENVTGVDEAKAADTEGELPPPAVDAEPKTVDVNMAATETADAAIAAESAKPLTPAKAAANQAANRAKSGGSGAMRKSKKNK